ncbi:NADP-dependent isocitrate dehydrogenase, partial [bacterium]
MTAKIIYTLTDEAPALATYSLLPIVQAFTHAAGIAVETRDISLAGRIVASFPDSLAAGQKQKDDLAELGELAKTPEANIIKLPNISASVPQLKGAIKELQGQGYSVPDYPEEPEGDAQKKIKARYAKVLGSAVNPVLREGNSDRRVAKAVKQYAKAHPHSMGAWSKDSSTRVASMAGGDFYANEQAAEIEAAGQLRIEFTDAAGQKSVLKDGIKVLPKELVSSTFLQAEGLREFYRSVLADAKSKGLLASLHLKATMMKVSDPILFGHAVSVFFADVFSKHAATFDRIGVNPNNGFGDVLAKIATLPAAEKAA